MQDADLLQLLRDCYTSTGRNIVDARLVRSAILTLDTEAPGAGITGVPPRYLATVTLYAPGSDDTINTQLVAQIENRLLGVESISHVALMLLPPLFAIL